MRAFFGAFAKNTVFANIVLAIIFVAGIMAATNMVRETFPEMQLDMITVAMAWPGADPEEVEEGIVRRIEEAIEGIEGIKQYHATAGESFGRVRIEVEEDFDVDFVKEKVRNGVESISTFPIDAEKPVTEVVRLESRVLIMALYGEGLTQIELKEWAERVKEELQALPEITQVSVLGAREYEIAIEVSEERLREYGLSFAEVSEVVRQNSVNLSGGTMRTKGEEIRLRTMGRRYTAKEFAELVVLARPNGEIITLDRIAQIHDGFTEDQVYSRFNGRPSISVMVSKTQEQDTLAIHQAVQEYVARKRMVLPEGMYMETWAHMADVLQARISLLSRNGIIGLCLVFILLWVFLDIRLSFWAGMGMPISILGAMAIMWVTGSTLNMISLFGLIMVLGIIVDDAIVVGEAIYVARKNGAPPLRAAIDGVTEVGMPVVAAVTTTIVAFVPLCFVGGIMGKFIQILPVVVVACLTISLVECLILLPAHLSHLPNFSARHVHGNAVRRFGMRFHRITNEGLEKFVAQHYEPFITRLLQWRYVTIAVAVAVLFMTLGLQQSGILKFRFFPDIDGDSLMGNIEFPNGTPLEVTQAAAERLEESIVQLGRVTPTASGDPLVENVFTLVGYGMGGGGRGSHVTSCRVEVLDPAVRGIHTDELLALWEKELGKVSGAVSVSFSGDEEGPGGAPIEVWLQGRDMNDLLSAADEVQAQLSSYDGVYQIQNDYRSGKNEIRLRLKPEARTLGLTVADLARQVYSGYFGEQAARIQRGRDDVRVRVRYPKEERQRFSEFEQVRIRTPVGSEVPLLSVADVDFGPGFSSITRTDGRRRVSVTADVNPAAANAQEVVTDLRNNFFPELNRRYPHVQLSFEGEQKDMRESFASLYIGYPLALLGIFIIIATVFRSYLQPLVIMITVPFGIIGAMLGHLLLGFDLSIMSMFGMVALSGVVVNDAIVLIESINMNVARGEPFYTAIRKGGARRFRAIFLTTLSTVGGLTPLIMEQDMQARFLIPMAVSIAAGVAFATLLTLVLIPCLLAALNDLRRVSFWLFNRRWPNPEEVEPARDRLVDRMREEAVQTPPRVPTAEAEA